MTQEVRCRIDSDFHDSRSGQTFSPNPPGSRPNIQKFSLGYAQRLERHGFVTILDDDLGRPKDEEPQPPEDQNMSPDLETKKTESGDLEEVVPEGDDLEAEPDLEYEGIAMTSKAEEIARDNEILPSELREIDPDGKNGKILTNQVRELVE